MIIINYADLWLIHFHGASLLDSAKLELRGLKACSTLFDAYTSCPLLRSDLEDLIVEIKDLTNLIILLATLFYLLHAKRVSLSRVSFL
jgi:hypothetical protein